MVPATMCRTATVAVLCAVVALFITMLGGAQIARADDVPAPSVATSAAPSADEWAGGERSPHESDGPGDDWRWDDASWDDWGDWWWDDWAGDDESPVEPIGETSPGDVSPEEGGLAAGNDALAAPEPAEPG